VNWLRNYQRMAKKRTMANTTEAAGANLGVVVGRGEMAGVQKPKVDLNIWFEGADQQLQMDMELSRPNLLATHEQTRVLTPQQRAALLNKAAYIDIASREMQEVFEKGGKQGLAEWVDAQLRKTADDIGYAVDDAWNSVLVGNTSSSYIPFDSQTSAVVSALKKERFDVVRDIAKAAQIEPLL